MGTLKILFMTLCNIRVIFNLENDAKSRYILLSDLLRITFKYLFIVKFFRAKRKREKVLGYCIRFLDYETFYSLFLNIFIHREYDFVSKYDSPLIVDCGTNFGMSALYLKRKYPNSKIICFEPHSETFNILKENIQANNIKNVELHNAAVYNRKGKFPLYADLDRRNVTGMSLTQRLIEKGMRLSEETVQTILLSDYINLPVDFLKMDIEGVEADALSELQEKSKLEFIDQIICEYHYNISAKTNQLSRLLGILEQGGFQYMVYSPEKLPFVLHRRKPYNILLYAYR